ncbi:MAG: carboxypeptidase-like regulatory domain-containing protein [Bacteroidales bacterium]
MKKLLILILLLPFGRMHAQVTISGTVKDEYKNPLTGANIYLKGTYTGATSDTSGYFSFTTPHSDTALLVVAFIGYETIEKQVVLIGYNYESLPDESGIFRSHPIHPFAKRTFVAAIFISIK